MANANGWGGARPGAGRKPRRQKFPNEAMLADSEIAKELVELVKVLKQLAYGGIPQVVETKEAAGLLTVGAGEYLRAVFPDKPADEMVVTKQVLSYTLPDRAAAENLVNRIMGVPGLVADADEGGDAEDTGPTIHRFLAGEGDGPSKGQTTR